MPSPETGHASSILERFPDHWQLIVERSRESEDFRELCEHFAECQSVLRLERSKPIPNARQIYEYEELIQDLEREVRHAIDAS